MFTSIAVLILLYTLNKTIDVPTACFVLTYIALGLNVIISIFRIGKKYGENNYD